MLAPLGDMVDYVEYDVEKKDRYGEHSFAEVLLQRKIRLFLGFLPKQI